MSPMDNDNLLKSPQVRDFMTVAVEFCVFTEKAESYKREDILSYYQKISPLLYLKGAVLPPLMPSNPDALQRFVNEHDWERVFNNLRDKIGIENDAIKVPRPDDENTGNPVSTISLAEQISDVYQDMKDCVMLFSKNTDDTRENALSEIHKLFGAHWGPRLILIMQAAHNLLYLAQDQNESSIF